MKKERIVEIIKQVKASKKVAAENETYTTSVKLDSLQDILNEKLLDTLKKEWKLKEIDIKELDWSWKETPIKWEVSDLSKSRYLTLHISCPDQTIHVTGNVTYMDEDWEKNDKEYEYDFDINLEIKDAKVELEVHSRDNTIDVAPQELELYKKKWTLKF